MYDLKYLCFMSVCETNSFSNTATELMLTQQSVSRHIQKLEEELGFRLFIRDQNMVSPTIAGRELLRFLNESNERFQEISLKKQTDEQILRIGISDWVGNNELLKETTRRFLEKNPKIQIIFCMVTNEKAKEMISHRLLDAFITTSYSLTKLNIPCNIQYLSTTQLCLLESAEFKPKWVHFTASSGEQQETCVKARDIRIYQEVNLPLRQIKVLLNYDSVLWNTSMGNGYCFMPLCHPITSSTHFKIQKLDFPVDMMIGIFSKRYNHVLCEFSDLVKEVMG